MYWDYWGRIHKAPKGKSQTKVKIKNPDFSIFPDKYLLQRNFVLYEA